MEERPFKLFQVCDRRRGPAPADSGCLDITQSSVTGSSSHMIWMNVIARDRFQAIRIASDYLDLQRPAAMSFPVGSDVNGITVEEFIALHIDNAPCAAGYAADVMKREVPPGTRVKLLVRAGDVGNIMQAFEYDCGATIMGWDQNCPGVSSEVEIDFVAEYLPPLWNGADVSLLIERFSDGLKFTFTIHDHCRLGQVKRAPRNVDRHLIPKSKVEDILS